MKCFLHSVFFATILFTLTSCNHSQEAKALLRVGSAISLQPVLEDAIALYARTNPNHRISVSYAGSGTLRQQIRFGAPIDVYLSASPDHIDSLAAMGLIETSSRTALASNRLLLIMSVQRTPINGLKDLRLPSITRIAIGEPDVVPAGRYAQESLRRTSMLPFVQKKLLFTKDVQQVLVYVRTGAVDAGIVYASDVHASPPVRIIETIPDTLHAPIVYEGVVLARSRSNEAATRFLAYLSSDSVKTIFRSHAFVIASP